MKRVTILILMLAAPAARAGVIAGYDPNSAASHATYDRFSSGYPSAPVDNTSTSFIANGYGNDLSGVGWLANNTAESVSLVTPRHFIGAAHVYYSPGTQIIFRGSDGVLNTATVQTARVLTTTFTDSNGQTQTKNSDAFLGTLTAPLPVTVAYYPILKAPVGPAQQGFTTQADFYNNQPLINYGTNASYSSSPTLGRNTLAAVQPVSFSNFTGSEATVAALYQYDPNSPGNFYLTGGDSGGPSFIPYQNQLTLLGGHYVVSNATSSPNAGDISVDSFLPFYTDQINSFLAQDADATHPNGYALTLINPVPEPGFLLLAGAGVIAARYRKAIRWG